MTKQSDLTKGVMLAILTAVISGVSIFYSKIAVVRIDPLVLTSSRNLLVGVMFVILVAVTGKHRELKNLPARDIFKLTIIGLIGGSIPFYLFFSGLRLIGAQQANIIHKSLFVWVALLAFVFLKEKINAKLLTAGILILIGTYLFTPLKVAMGQGTLMILAADLFWAAETLLAKKVLRGVSAELVGLSRMLIGGLILAGAAITNGNAGAVFRLTPAEYSLIAVGSMLLFFYVYTWFKSLSFAPANIVTFVLTGSLVVGTMLNGTFAHVGIVGVDLYSILFIMGGILVSIFSAISRKPAPAPVNKVNK